MKSLHRAGSTVMNEIERIQNEINEEKYQRWQMKQSGYWFTQLGVALVLLIAVFGIVILVMRP